MSNLIEVRATTKALRVLKHVPSGEGFDEHGHGLWPNDAFTFRLIGEGALKLISDDPKPDAPAKADTAHKGA